MRWKTLLLNDLETLEQLRGADQTSQLRYALKEQELGLHCYQAEEVLTDAQLALLKEAVQLSDLRWRVYKSKLWPPPSPV